VHKSEDQSTFSGCSQIKTVTELDANRTLTVRTFPRPDCSRELIASLNSKFAISLRARAPYFLNALQMRRHANLMAIEVGWPSVSSMVGDMRSFTNWKENSDSNIS